MVLQIQPEIFTLHNINFKSLCCQVLCKRYRIWNCLPLTLLKVDKKKEGRRNVWMKMEMWWKHTGESVRRRLRRVVEWHLYTPYTMPWCCVSVKCYHENKTMKFYFYFISWAAFCCMYMFKIIFSCCKIEKERKWKRERKIRYRIEKSCSKVQENSTNVLAKRTKQRVIF